ncbi:MAG: tetratricopeptide repeat protein [Acidobacteria bacterium]|nr:MAG: tetratricopeptide repeat protein [Acidobacteriota bacterium]
MFFQDNVFGRLRVGLRYKVMFLRAWLLLVCMAVSPIAGTPHSFAFPQQTSASFAQAVEAFQQGHYAEAENAARALVRQDTRDARALGLLGVILDAQKKYEEAEPFYLQALRLAPHSASLHNNLGNHYLAQGSVARARAQFLKVVEIDPGHPNANLQLAEMSIKAKDGNSALEYLSHLPESALAGPAPALLHAQALHLAGKTKEAEQALDRIAQQAGNDPRIAFSIGMVDAGWNRYAEAEEAFGQALKADPANFDIQYNLGLAALNARDFGRALDMFQAAYRQKPDDPDVLLDLARAYSGAGHDDQAIILLVKAMKLAPKRPDILLAAAQTSERLGFYVDAGNALEKYHRLKPGDDVAWRELGYVLIQTAKLDEGERILSAYVSRHPKDAQGLYELGIAESVRDKGKALAHLNAALALDPSLNGARYARAVLVAQQGKYQESIIDLRKILETEPRNTNALYSLGDDLLMVNRPAEAVKVLAQGAELAPQDPKILQRYSRALLRAGNPAEAQAIMQRFQAIRPTDAGPRPNAGLFDYLSLTPQQQRERYMGNLRRNIELNPQDLTSLTLLAKALLMEGKTAEAIEDYKKIQPLTSDPKVLAGCGRELLDAGQYGPARDFLAAAMKQAASSGEASVEDLRLDLSVAIFHGEGAADALAELDKTPASFRHGDYYLLRAQILDSMGKDSAAAADLNRGISASPTRANLYFEAALFLIKHAEYQQTIRLLDLAKRAVPGDPGLMLVEAITYEILQRFNESQKLLAEIQSRWPEWSQPYLIDGIILQNHFKQNEAKQKLETAIALGASDPRAYFYLASACLDSNPQDFPGANKAIEKGLEIAPDNAELQWQAGKIDLAEKRYGEAVDHLQAAVRLDSSLVAAHETLRATYLAMGEKDKSMAESKEIVRLKQLDAAKGTSQGPPAISAPLFTVRLPPSREAATDP